MHRPRPATAARPHASLALAPLALAALLAGCDDGSMKFAPACPQLSLLAEGADLVRFGGPTAGQAATQGRDVTDRALDARITAVDAACRGARNGDVVSTLKLRADLRRGPAAPDRRVQVPYFVAVLDGETVIDRREFVLQGSFPPNTDTLRLAGDELELRFPAAGDRGAARYRILVSFQLTADELAYNRRLAR